MYLRVFGIKNRKMSQMTKHRVPRQKCVPNTFQKVFSKGLLWFSSCCNSEMLASVSSVMDSAILNNKKTESCFLLHSPHQMGKEGAVAQLFSYPEDPTLLLSVVAHL